MSEVKQAVESLHNAFAEFRQANDERINALEKNVAPDPIAAEKVDKLNEEMTRLGDQVQNAMKQTDRLELAINRSGFGGAQKGEELQASANQFFAMSRKQVTPATPEQVDQYSAYRNALNEYWRRGEAITPEIRNAMSIGSDPDGGFWVTPEMSQTIATLVYETSPIRQVANVTTISTDALEGFNDLDEASSGGWVGEVAARSDTNTPQIGKWRIPVFEQYAQPKATQTLLDDASVNVEGYLSAKIADKLARDENTAFVNGSGADRPRGFLQYDGGTPSATTWNVIQRVASGAAGAFAASDPGDNVIDLVFSLKNAYRSNARFMMTRLTLAEVRKLKDGQGNYLWTPDFTQQQNGALVGYPITEAEDMPEIASASLSIAFGDFRTAYQVVDRQGIRVLRDPFTDKPNVRFYSTKRTGGDVVNFEALKLMEFSVSV